MKHFLYQDSLTNSYWLIKCDTYYRENDKVHCNNSDIISFQRHDTLSEHEELVLKQRYAYKIIEQYCPVPDLPVDTWLLAV